MAVSISPLSWFPAMNVWLFKVIRHAHVATEVHYLEVLDRLKTAEEIVIYLKAVNSKETVNKNLNFYY